MELADAEVERRALLAAAHTQIAATAAEALATRQVIWVVDPTAPFLTAGAAAGLRELWTKIGKERFVALLPLDVTRKLGESCHELAKAAVSTW
jgi:hypothetical protein